MTGVTDARLVALEPLRAALLARARAEGERVLEAAGEDGRQVLAAARDEAAALLADARTQGEADAAALLAVERAQARRAARGVVLGAQRAVYDELRRRARTAVQALLADPDRRARLADVACGRLGDHAIVRDLPDGGVAAETPDGRTIDASVDALVDGALADLDLEQLWATS